MTTRKMGWSALHEAVLMEDAALVDALGGEMPESP